MSNDRKRDTQEKDNGQSYDPITELLGLDVQLR